MDQKLKIEQEAKFLKSYLQANTEFEVTLHSNSKVFFIRERAEYEPGIEILIPLPQHPEHVQEDFSVSTIMDSTGKEHWFVNAWFYEPVDEADKKVFDAQKLLIEKLLEIMPDINITIADDDGINYNVNGSWPSEDELWNEKCRLEWDGVGM